MLYANIIEFFTHLDDHLKESIQRYGAWTYAILFAVVFCETGLVIMPFLPGDSLLFATGILSHPDQRKLNVWIVAVTFICAALVGDNVNYWVGRTLGPKLFRNDKSRWFKRENLNKTHEFFERYGGRTIIMARFVPIVRTFAPCVAGMGAMTYLKFLAYSVIGAFIWVGVCVGAGYLFGGIPWVRDNFSIAVLAVILATIVPVAVEFARHRLRKKPASPEKSEKSSEAP